MTITASAPGKLVLFGDHAAVYGKPCLVTAVDLRFQVSVTQRADSLVEIDTPDLRAAGETYRVSPSRLSAHNRKETAFVEAALRQFLQHYPTEHGLQIRTEGPQVMYGLGSSSAITAATLAACAALQGIDLTPRALFDLSYAAVLDVQHTGSGVDLAAAVYGGTLYYADWGTIIEPLAIHDLPLVIGYSGAKVSTTSLIAHVADLRSRHPVLIDSLLHTLGELSASARAGMLRTDWQAVGELADVHQGILDGFGVSTPQLARLIFAARAAGAWGAKISGAGGGDCMLALASESNRRQVESAIEQAGGQPVRLKNTVEGVRIDS